MKRIVLLVSLALLACGDDHTAADPDAATGPACPAEPPANGATCTDYAEGTGCIYERCASDGLIRARCQGGAWAVTTDACDQLTCQGEACIAGQVCAARAGGALIVGCSAHSCGDGPLTCDCVCGDQDCAAYGAGDGDSIFTCYVDCGADICP